MALLIPPDDAQDGALLAGINTTPLVDVMLVLLIIFLITIPVVTSSVMLSLPNERVAASQTRPDSIIISVDRQGQLFWFDARLPNADALARRDHAFLGHTLHRSMRYTAVIATLGVTLLLVSYPLLLSMWLREPPAVALGFVAAVALWTLIQALGNAWAMYMNGCSIVRPQVLVVVPFACLSLALKWWWLPWLGVIAIPLATALSYLLCTVVPFLTVFRRAILEPVAATDGPKPAPEAKTQ
jgi:hypothetical protein